MPRASPVVFQLYVLGAPKSCAIVQPTLGLLIEKRYWGVPGHVALPVSVTVGHNGLPTDIKMTDAVRKMTPDEIAASVMRAIQKAQSKYPERMQAILAETVGDDDTTQHLVATAVDNFPPPPAEEEPEPAPETPRRQFFEQAEDEAPGRPVPPPAPTPRSAPRRPPSDDDGDFSDESFLRRD